MPEKIDPKVEGIVPGVSEPGMTQRSFVARLKHQNIVISENSVPDVLNGFGKRLDLTTKSFPSPGKGQPRPEANEWFGAQDNFSKHFMVVGAINGRGTLPLIRILKNCKASVRYYIDEVLRPLFEVLLPKLYPYELPKVTIHDDQASSPTARLTPACAIDLKQMLGKTLLKNNQIPAESPDASPMNFFDFRFLKPRVLRQRARTELGLWKLPE